MSSWEDWFNRHGDYVVLVRYYEGERTFSVEELYQAFKERLAAAKADEQCN